MPFARCALPHGRWYLHQRPHYPRTMPTHHTTRLPLPTQLYLRFLPFIFPVAIWDPVALYTATCPAPPYCTPVHTRFLHYRHCCLDYCSSYTAVARHTPHFMRALLHHPGRRLPLPFTGYHYSVVTFIPVGTTAPALCAGSLDFPRIPPPPPLQPFTFRFPFCPLPYTIHTTCAPPITLPHMVPRSPNVLCARAHPPPPLACPLGSPHTPPHTRYPAVPRYPTGLPPIPPHVHADMGSAGRRDLWKAQNLTGLHCGEARCDQWWRCWRRVGPAGGEQQVHCLEAVVRRGGR